MAHGRAREGDGSAWSEVSVALLELQLAHRVRRDWPGLYARIDRRPWPEALAPASLSNDEHAQLGPLEALLRSRSRARPAGGSG